MVFIHNIYLYIFLQYCTVYIFSRIIFKKKPKYIVCFKKTLILNQILTSNPTLILSRFFSFIFSFVSSWWMIISHHRGIIFIPIPMIIFLLKHTLYNLFFQLTMTNHSDTDLITMKFMFFAQGSNETPPVRV